MSSASGSGAGAGAEGRRITIKSISCRGVRAFVPFQKPPLYAAVSLGARREKTQPDADGSECPDWDVAAFSYDLDGDGAQQLVVEFEVKAQVPILGNKLVGTESGSAYPGRPSGCRQCGSTQQPPPRLVGSGYPEASQWPPATERPARARSAAAERPAASSGEVRR